MALVRLIPVVVCAAAIAFGPAVWASAPVFADGAAPAAAATEWPAAFSTLGVAGVLAWYLWYTTAIGHPKMRQEFAECAAAEREAYREERARERDTAKELADRQDARVEQLCTALANLASELRRRPCLAREERPDGA